MHYELTLIIRVKNKGNFHLQPSVGFYIKSSNCRLRELYDLFSSRHWDLGMVFVKLQMECRKLKSPAIKYGLSLHLKGILRLCYLVCLSMKVIDIPCRWFVTWKVLYLCVYIS